MTWDCFKGECEVCGEKDKFVIVPHGQEGHKGICEECAKELIKKYKEE